METTGGLILCGGKSSRMGYDKAALRFEGETLLERVLGRMRQVASPVVVCSSANAPAPVLPQGVLMTRDEQPELGPLWGLLEGFRALAGKARQVLVLPVDMPFFTVDWMRRLETGLADRRACLCEYEGVANALTAAYRMELLPKLESLVAEGRMRPMFLCRDEPSRIIRVEDHWRDGEGAPPMMDVDTPEAYRNALLMEGIGNADGVPVTIEWMHRKPVEAAHAALPNLPVFAASTEEALGWARRLYPEFQPALERAGKSGGLQVFNEDGSAHAVDGRTKLMAGVRIAVDLEYTAVGGEG